MHFFIFALLICFINFLFCLYLVAHDDLFFLKKNITMEKLFNMAFLTGFIALFSSRFVYALSHFSRNFLNPLVFFLFPYFPGLSLLGGIIGGALFLSYYCRIKKYPLLKIYDSSAVALLSCLPLGFLGLFFLEGSVHFGFIHLILAFLYAGILLLFLRIILPRVEMGKIKEGTVSLLLIIVFSIFSIIENTMLLYVSTIFVKSRENIIFVVILLFAMVILFHREKLLSKIKRERKKNKFRLLKL